MKQTKAIKLAYTAGIVDGEGSICIVKRRRHGINSGRSTQYFILVSVVQKDGSVIDWLKGNFDGNVVLKNKANDGSDWIYQWRIQDKKAYEFLKLIFPFLLVKKSQAELAIRFQERLKFARKKNVDINGHYIPLTEHELSQREEIFLEIKRLKHCFRKSKVPNVKEYTFKSMVQA